MPRAHGDLAGSVLPRLLHLGNVVVDVVMYVPSLPTAGGDVLAARTQMAAGGGFNVMAAAGRQGLAVAYAGTHGTGPFGDLARTALASERITVLQPRRERIDTGFVMAAVDPDGERTFVTSPGAEATLSDADLAAVTPGERDVVYLSGYSLAHRANASALLRWLARLPGSQMVIFDPGPLAGSLPAEKLAAVLARTTWLTCNGRESAALTGASGPARAARLLATRLRDGRGQDDRPAESGPAESQLPEGSTDAAARTGVLVRTSAQGCLLAMDDGEPVTIPGFPVTPLDTNGAGDTHTGVFVAAVAAGLSPAQAALRANAAAALSVTRRGPATCPEPAEIDRLLAGADDRGPS